MSRRRGRDNIIDLTINESISTERFHHVIDLTLDDETTTRRSDAVGKILEERIPSLDDETTLRRSNEVRKVLEGRIPSLSDLATSENHVNSSRWGPFLSKPTSSPTLCRPGQPISTNGAQKSSVSIAKDTALGHRTGNQKSPFSLAGRSSDSNAGQKGSEVPNVSLQPAFSSNMVLADYPTRKRKRDEDAARAHPPGGQRVRLVAQQPTPINKQPSVITRLADFTASSSARAPSAPHTQESIRLTSSDTLSSIRKQASSTTHTSRSMSGVLSMINTRATPSNATETTAAYKAPYALDKQILGTGAEFGITPGVASSRARLTAGTPRPDHIRGRGSNTENTSTNALEISANASQTSEPSATSQPPARTIPAHRSVAAMATGRSRSSNKQISVLEATFSNDPKAASTEMAPSHLDDGMDLSVEPKRRTPAAPPQDSVIRAGAGRTQSPINKVLDPELHVKSVLAVPSKQNPLYGGRGLSRNEADSAKTSTELAILRERSRQLDRSVADTIGKPSEQASTDTQSSAVKNHAFTTRLISSITESDILPASGLKEVHKPSSKSVTNQVGARIRGWQTPDESIIEPPTLGGTVSVPDTTSSGVTKPQSSKGVSLSTSKCAKDVNKLRSKAYTRNTKVSFHRPDGQILGGDHSGVPQTLHEERHEIETRPSQSSKVVLEVNKAGRIDVQLETEFARPSILQSRNQENNDLSTENRLLHEERPVAASALLSRLEARKTAAAHRTPRKIISKTQIEIRSKDPLGNLRRDHAAIPRSVSESTRDGSQDGPVQSLTALTLTQVESMLENNLNSFEDSHRGFIKECLSRARCNIAGESRRWLQQKSPFNIQYSTRDPTPDHTRPARIMLRTESHVQNSSRKTGEIPLTTYVSVAPEVPPYSHHTRLKANILVQNEKNLIVYPADDHQPELAEKDFHEELRELFTHGIPDERYDVVYHNQMVKQLWPAVATFLSSLGCSVNDVLRFFIDPETTQTVLPGVPKVLHLRKRALKEAAPLFRSFEQWDPILAELPASTSEGQELVRLAGAAFQSSRYGMSIWHFVESEALKLLSRATGVTDVGLSKTLALHTSLACRICYEYDCSRHGNFDEKRPDGYEAGGSEGDVKQNNDSEPEDQTLGCNFKGRILSTVHDTLIMHEEQPLTATISPRVTHHQRGRVRGTSSTVARSSPDLTINEATTHLSWEVSPEDYDYSCSNTCALDKKAKAAPFIDIEESLRRFTVKERELVRSLLPAFGMSPRGSCLIAMAVQKPCTHVAVLLENLKDDKIADNLASLETSQPNVRRNAAWCKVHASKTGELYERAPFYPCRHEGSCEDARCRCFKQHILCEKSCGCSASCERRYRGCICDHNGIACWQDSHCDCFALDRECDPDLCGGCGASEVLKADDRHDHSATTNLCANVSIQRSLPKRLILGQSQVAGFGLFVGQPVKKWEYLGEYKGEILSKGESLRRKTLYQHAPREYTFLLNSEQELDGTHAGNKIRFINNSKINNNCFAKPMLCNTVTRIGLYAWRDLHVGEELFFDYGYPEVKTGGFKEIKLPTVVPVRVAKASKKTSTTRLLDGIKNGTSGSRSRTVEETASESAFEDEADAELEGILQAIRDREGNESDDDDFDDRVSRTTRPASPSPERRQEKRRHGKRKRV